MRISTYGEGRVEKKRTLKLNFLCMNGDGIVCFSKLGGDGGKAGNKNLHRLGQEQSIIVNVLDPD